MLRIITSEKLSEYKEYHKKYLEYKDSLRRQKEKEARAEALKKAKYKVGDKVLDGVVYEVSFNHEGRVIYYIMNEKGNYIPYWVDTYYWYEHDIEKEMEKREFIKKHFS
jgi:hypothetical protein